MTQVKEIIQEASQINLEQFFESNHIKEAINKKLGEVDREASVRGYNCEKDWIYRFYEGTISDMDSSQDGSSLRTQ